VAWPLAARAPQGERIKRVGMLLPATADDSEYPTLVNAFLQRLQQLGWSDGGNLQIHVRWGSADAGTIHKHASELVALAPDVIFASGAASAGPLLQTTRNIPVVFAIVPDPVGAGFVDSLAHPGGNATGFTSFEYGVGGKWLEILKETASNVTRVGVLRDASITAGIGQWSAIQTAAPMFGLDASPINLRDALDLKRVLTAFAHPTNSGLIITSSALAVRHRDGCRAQAACNILREGVRHSWRPYLLRS
jgi:putative ABC transport system substrate-binding protein